MLKYFFYHHGYPFVLLIESVVYLPECKGYGAHPDEPAYVDDIEGFLVAGFTPEDEVEYDFIRWMEYPEAVDEIINEHFSEIEKEIFSHIEKERVETMGV